MKMIVEILLYDVLINDEIDLSRQLLVVEEQLSGLKLRRNTY